MSALLCPLASNVKISRFLSSARTCCPGFAFFGGLLPRWGRFRAACLLRSLSPVLVARLPFATLHYRDALCIHGFAFKSLVLVRLSRKHAQKVSRWLPNVLVQRPISPRTRRVTPHPGRGVRCGGKTARRVSTGTHGKNTLCADWYAKSFVCAEEDPERQKPILNSTTRLNVFGAVTAGHFVFGARHHVGGIGG